MTPTSEIDILEAALNAIATKITQHIYSAPIDQATRRQRDLAFVAAGNALTALRQLGWMQGDSQQVQP